MAVIKPSPTPVQAGVTKTGLITTVNGTHYDVTPDPPPVGRESWSNLNTTLPPLSIDADTPDATVLALIVSGAIHAGSGQYPGPTISAETASANDAISGTSAGGDGVRGTSTSGVGVSGASATNDAIQGRSQSSQHAGVSGVNTGGGPGVWAQGNPAGYFNGDIHVTGDVVLPNAGSGGTSLSLKDLNSRLEKAEQALAQLAVHVHNYTYSYPSGAIKGSWLTTSDVDWGAAFGNTIFATYEPAPPNSGVEYLGHLTTDTGPPVPPPPPQNG